MEHLTDRLQAAAVLLDRLAWGGGTIGLLALCGLVFSAATGFFQVRGARRWLAATLGSLFQK